MVAYVPPLYPTYKVERVRTLANAGGKTLYFLIRTGTRRQPTTFFSPEEVPEFDGEEAWFEIDRRRRPWKFIRQVAKPSSER